MRGLADLFSLCVPTWCVLCGTPDSPVCVECRTRIRPDPMVRMLPVGPNQRLPVVVAGTYAEELRAVILAYKDGGRADTVGALVPLLAHSLAVVLSQTSQRGGEPGILCVPIPSTTRGERERGFRHVDVLLARALRSLARAHPAHPAHRESQPRLGRVLRNQAAARRSDQVGLGQGGRRRNLRNTLTAAPSVFGRHIIIVDDVVTSGATLQEANRALVLRGARVIAAVALANTAKHHRS